MVSFDICQDWFHVACIGLQDDFVENVLFFHCRNCISEVYLTFLQYIRCELDRKDLTDAAVVGNLYHKFAKKTSETKEIIKTHSYPALPHLIPIPSNGFDVTSSRGIINLHNNCWLNSSVQVMCGTILKTLIVREEFRDDPVITSFEEAVHFLSLQYAKHEPKVNQVPGCMIDLARYVNMSATDGEQHDSGELYSQLLQHLIENHPSSDYRDTFNSTVINIRMCLSCSVMYSQAYEKSVIEVNAVELEQPLTIRSLLWNRCTGLYSLERKAGIFYPHCKGKSKPGLHDTQFFLRNSTILVLSINRTRKDSDSQNHSPVIIPEELDISEVSVRYDNPKCCQYKLFAAISRHGNSFQSGHFTATLLDENDAHTFDNKHISTKKKYKWLNELNVMKNVYLLFYVRELDIERNENVDIVHPWLLRHQDQKLVEKLWFDDVPSSLFEIELQDLHKLCGNKSWLNDNIINAFIPVIASECKTLSIRALSTYFLLGLTKKMPVRSLQVLWTMQKY